MIHAAVNQDQLGFRQCFHQNPEQDNQFIHNGNDSDDGNEDVATDALTTELVLKLKMFPHGDEKQSARYRNGSLCSHANTVFQVIRNVHAKIVSGNITIRGDTILSEDNWQEELIVNDEFSNEDGNSGDGNGDNNDDEDGNDGSASDGELFQGTPTLPTNRRLMDSSDDINATIHPPHTRNKPSYRPDTDSDDEMIPLMIVKRSFPSHNSGKL